jgi:hypothetical protein
MNPKNREAPTLLPRDGPLSGVISAFVIFKQLAASSWLLDLKRLFLTWRESLASGLHQSTNLPFIVVAVTVGTELGRLGSSMARP